MSSRRHNMKAGVHKFEKLPSMVPCIVEKPHASTCRQEACCSNEAMRGTTASPCQQFQHSLLQYQSQSKRVPGPRIPQRGWCGIPSKIWDVIPSRRVLMLALGQFEARQAFKAATLLGRRAYDSMSQGKKYTD